MKTPSGSIAAKITAVFCFFLSLILLAVSVVGTVILFREDAYFDGGRSLRNDVIDYAADTYRGQLYRYANQRMWELEPFDNAAFEDTFSEDNCNYYFTLYNSVDGEVVLTNYTPADSLRDYGTEPFCNYHSAEIWTEDGSGNSYYEEYYYDLILISGVRKDLIAKDRIYYLSSYTDLLIGSRYILIIATAVLPIIIIVLFVFLMCAAGHHHGETTPRPNMIDRIPFDIYLTGVATVVFLAIHLCQNYFHNDLVAIAAITALIPFALAVLLTVATRIKTKTLITNTIFYRVVVKGTVLIWKTLLKLPLYWKTAMVWCGISLIEFFVLLTAERAYLLLIWFVWKSIATPLIVWIVLNLQTLRKAGKELAGGNIEHTVDTKGMLPVFKEHADHLNGIGEGLKVAVDKSTRNERMRAELITNVSHDIKTPLTSLINYVDLLKKEGLDGEHAEDYLCVLERQSIRLKKLTEDLIEASKASTGAIKVNATLLDANILLQQATAEYEERLEKRSLQLISDFRTEHAVIFADGRLLWRVFDNLLSNICKYAKADTRVYVLTQETNGHISIVFKNISAEPLNISGEELTERFVRGDRARNTEGSGLGLSIAKSLTELQGGTLDIRIDGDLFKSTITFERSQER